MSSAIVGPDRPQDDIDAIRLALLILRVLVPGLCIVAVVATFVWRAFVTGVTRLQNVGYDTLPVGPSTPAVGSPLNSAPGSAASKPAPTETDGIVAVVVPVRKPRRGLVYVLLALIALLYLCDGVVFIVRGVTTPVWEPRDAPAWIAMDWYSAEGLIAFCLCAIGMAYEERAAGEPTAWSVGYPRTVAGLSLVGDVAIAGLAAAITRRDGDGRKPSAFSIVHICLMVARLLALLLLVASYTRFLHRKSFKPADSIPSSSEPTSSYGTFARREATNDNTPTNGTATPPQKASGNALFSKPAERPAAKPAGLKSMLSRVVTLFPYLWPTKSVALQVVALICFLLIGVGRVVNLFVPITLGKVTQALTVGSAPWTPLGVYVALRFLQGSGGIISVFQSTLWVPVAQYADRSMSMMTFSHILELSMAYHSRRKTGEVIRILDRGSAINNFFQYLLFSITPIFLDIGFACVYLAVQFQLGLAVVVVLVMAAYVWASVLLTQWRTAIRRQMNDKGEAGPAAQSGDKYQRGIQNDSIINWETISYFVAKDFEVAKYLDATRDYQSSEFQVLSSLYLLNFVQNTIIAVALLVGCFSVAYQVNTGQKQVGDFVAFIAYLGQLVGPLNQLGTLYRVIQQNLVDTDNLMKLLAEPKEIEDRPGAATVTEAEGAIEFENVSFSYDGKVTVIDDVSFTIPAGKSVALVGESGSGKSTLLRLLFRFYDPTEGSIKLDGRDIRDVTQMSYRQQIGCVPQDSVLFNETIRYNIAYGNIRANPSMVDVEEAAKAAQIHDRIVGFPDGYESMVGERGLRLSGGEKQRVAIARVLIRNPPILLLDEATSSLDTLTEREIQSSLKKLAEGRTSVSIAHRLSTIVDSDLILVMKEGKIVERGTHGELLDVDGIYAKLWKRQIRAETEGLEIPGRPAGLSAVAKNAAGGGSASGSSTPGMVPAHPHPHHH